MNQLLYFLIILFCAASLLIGCTPTTQPAPATPVAQAVVLPTPTLEPAPAPTNPPAAAPAEPSTPEPTLPTALADWTTTATVEGDYYVLGNPQAPIRLIDFSDFF
jgi:hypothetical protein